MIWRVLGVAVILVVGVGVGYGLATGDPMAAVDAAGNVTIDAVSGPETETEIKRIEPDGRFAQIKSVVLFESGAANITFAEDHSPRDKLAFGHSQNDICEQHYRTWGLPEFSGPITIDLKSVVKSNGPYPDNKFTFDLISEANNLCNDSIDSRIQFTVPRSWVAE